MAFTVEDGSGLANATALVAVATVDAFWADRGGNATWDAIADIPSGATEEEQKQAAIVKASDYVRSHPGYRWRGSKKTAAQRMPWPRTGAQERDGAEALPDDAVPWQVVDAVCVLAPRAAAGENLFPDLTRGGQIASQTVGPISTSYFKNAPVGKVLQAVDGLVAPLLRLGLSDDPIDPFFSILSVPDVFVESNYSNLTGGAGAP